MKLWNPFVFVGKWIINLNLFGKVLALAFILILSTIGIGGVGLRGTAIMNGMVNDVIEDNLLPILYLYEIKKEMLELEILVKDIVVNNDTQQFRYVNEVALVNTEKMIDFYALQLYQFTTEKAWEKMGKVGYLDKLRDLNQIRPEYIRVYREIINRCLAGKTEEALVLLNQDAKKIRTITFGFVDEMTEQYRTDAINLKQHASSIYGGVWEMLLISLICTVLVAFLLSYGMAVYYGTRISNLTKVATEIADGNLYTQVEAFGMDEIGLLGQAFERMAANLKEIIRQNAGVTLEIADYSQRLAADTDKTSAGSAQVAAVTDEISLGVAQQERFINEMVITVEELREFTKSVAKTAAEMLKISTHTASVAGASRHMVGVTMEKIQSYQGLMAQNREAAHQLDEVSDEIQQMVGMVAEIAEQINLLSLNASIEAARAGEHGQGFAVVAEAINGLSDRTHELVKRVHKLTNRSKREIECVISAVDMGAAEVAEGNRLIQELGEAFITLTDFIQTVEIHVNTVATYVQEISQRHEDVLEGMKQVATIAEDNALDTMGLREFSIKQNEVTAELADLAHRLKTMGNRLVNVMNRFKTA